MVILLQPLWSWVEFSLMVVHQLSCPICGNQSLCGQSLCSHDFHGCILLQHNSDCAGSIGGVFFCCFRSSLPCFVERFDIIRLPWFWGWVVSGGWPVSAGHSGIRCWTMSLFVIAVDSSIDMVMCMWVCPPLSSCVGPGSFLTSWTVHLVAFVKWELKGDVLFALLSGCKFGVSGTCVYHLVDSIADVFCNGVFFYLAVCPRWSPVHYWGAAVFHSGCTPFSPSVIEERPECCHFLCSFSSHSSRMYWVSPVYPPGVWWFHWGPF